MTEQEWAVCIYPAAMLRSSRRKSTRKLRLLACSSARRVWRLLSTTARQAVKVAEICADSNAHVSELEVARPAFVQHGPIGDNMAHFLAAPNKLFRSWVESALSFAAWSVEVSGPKHDAELIAQCSLIRDIFGPLFFRDVPIDSRWISANHKSVVRLAEGVYDDEAFDRMPILADALEDAGCDNSDILDHCRGPGPHVRGCWVLDLLLSKK
jgi:hypothetical protein